jgi:anti-anti-sigma factor
MDDDFRHAPFSSFMCVEHRLADAVCLSVRGEVDLANVASLSASLQTVAENAKSLVVDLSALQYIDSAGIVALLQAHSSITRSGGRLALAAPSLAIQRILRIINVDQVLPVYSTVSAAVDSFRAADTTSNEGQVNDRRGVMHTL